MNKKIFLFLIFVLGIPFLIHRVSVSARSGDDVVSSAKTNQATVVKIVDFQDSSAQLASLNSAPAAQAKPQSGSALPITDSSQVSSVPKKPISAKTKSVVSSSQTSTPAPTKTTVRSVAKATVSTPVKTRVHYTSKYGTTMPWNVTSLNYLGHIAYFDYSTSIRAAVIRKIEAYARSHNISKVTMAMMNQMTGAQ